MLGSQIEEGSSVTSIASLAVVVLVKTAGVHLEDDQILEGGVRQSSLAFDIANALGRFGEVRTEPVGNELDFNFPSCCVAVENDSGLFDEGSDRVADDFLLDATGRGRLADDEVDALFMLECALV